MKETGLSPDHVAVLGVPGLAALSPARAGDPAIAGARIGQKQVWFLLQFTGQEADLRLDLTEKPEFVTGAGSTSGTRSSTW